MATRTATQETTSGTKRADAYLEPTIADIWPKGTKGNHFMKWFVFKLVANCTAITCCCLYYVAPLMATHHHSPHHSPPGSRPHA